MTEKIEAIVELTRWETMEINKFLVGKVFQIASQAMMGTASMPPDEAQKWFDLSSKFIKADPQIREAVADSARKGGS
jgi:hypothetical protein